MPFSKFLVPLLTGLVWTAGCTKPPAVAPPPTVLSTEPTQAQPRLATLKLWLGPEELITELALTEEQERTGMMFRTNMPENEAMIFVFPFPQRASFWMKNCPLPLSVAYIDSEGVIQEIHPLQSYDTNAVLSAAENIRYALETPQGWFDRHHIREGVTIRTERGTLSQTFKPAQ